MKAATRTMVAITARKALTTVAALAIVVASGAARAAPSEGVENYQAQKDRCEQARLAKLRPLRDQKIAQCVSAGRSKDECTSFYSTYGDNSNRANGSVVRGEFYDLPECRDARKALKDINGKQDF